MNLKVKLIVKRYRSNNFKFCKIIVSDTNRVVVSSVEYPANRFRLNCGGHNQWRCPVRGQWISPLSRLEFANVFDEALDSASDNVSTVVDVSQATRQAPVSSKLSLTSCRIRSQLPSKACSLINNRFWRGTSINPHVIHLQIQSIAFTWPKV